jgi:hypothetical protein
MLLFGIGIFLMIIALVATVLYTEFTLRLGFLEEMSGYTGLFVFGVAFIILLNWLDKHILIRRQTQ